MTVQYVLMPQNSVAARVHILKIKGGELFVSFHLKTLKKFSAAVR